MKNKIVRQGDILLKPIEEFPSNLKKKDLVLAYGEATGHMHQFIDPMAVSVFESLSSQQFVDVIEDSMLTHQEHNDLLVPKGKYEVINQREVDLSEEIRRVID